VSLDPPLVLVSLDNRCNMHRILPSTGRFGITVLAEDQEHLSSHFAGRPIEGLEVPFVTREGVPVFDLFYREIEQLYPDAPDKLKFNEALKRVLNRFADDLITNTRSRLQQSKISSLDDVRAHPHRLAAFSPAVDAERKQSKDFLYDSLYFSTALADEKDDADRVVGELFDYWMHHPDSLPHNYQDKAKEESLPRVICDYIAGMTDNYIFEQYQKHCGR
jgi:dGTPase